MSSKDHSSAVSRPEFGGPKGGLGPAGLGPAKTTAEFDEARKRAAKRSFNTARFDLTMMRTLVSAGAVPRPGDLLLARVGRLRHHKKLEDPSGRRVGLYSGDEILVCYGDRYAPDQFEALVPGDLGPCHLVAGGGVAARVTVRHGAVAAATEIVPIGLVGDASGAVLNLRNFGLRPRGPLGTPRSTVFAVVGSSMNSGKTTTAANCVHGLVRAGLHVGAAKVTGTGSGGDRWQLVDAGANEVLDFTDIGHVSTYRLPIDEVISCFEGLVNELVARGCEAVVIEVADGLYQQETEALLRSPRFVSRVDGVFFAAADAMAATSGVEWLRREGLPVLAVSGLVTRSPLASREAEARLDVPVLRKQDLANPAWIGRQVRENGRQLVCKVAG